ncbi:MAG TPA: hypothetical protein VFS83_05995 [Ktedonobacterales bacterium]|nr:hypothetical protein [Ktedonobacterales bacterium]
MENQGPFVTIPLRNGALAAVGYNGVHVGERTFALADIQDARQVAPDPLTIALRVANERHVVELQPAQAGDGALLLEALFRLRPELRPAGFEAPVTLPAGFPPLPQPTQQPTASTPWGAHPSWPPHPGMYPPPPQPSLPPSASPYAFPRYPSVGATGGRLTPYPRRASELIGATFALFAAHWRSWLLLGLVALFAPQVINGVVDSVFHVLGGNNLWAGLTPASQGAGGGLGIGSTTLPQGRDLLLSSLDLLLTSIVGVLISGWSAAVLGNAGRNALFGRDPKISASLRAGFKRAFAAIGASVLSGAIVLLILLPVLVLYGILLTQFGDALKNPSSLDSSSPAGAAFTLLGCLTLLFMIPCIVFAIYVYVRLILSPYIAATEALGPVAALRRSWNLTRRQWAHVVWPLFVIALVVAVISFPFSFVEYASYGVAALIVNPLISALTAPLVALAAVSVLYDVRLRREGYASLADEGVGEEQEPTSV